MNKDIDERIVPNGEYRDALNIEVSTSEDSDVGAAQNILGNRQVSWAANGPALRGWSGSAAIEGDKNNVGLYKGRYEGSNMYVGHAIDKENDSIYLFTHTNTMYHDMPGIKMDRIIEYREVVETADAPERTMYSYQHERAVLVDVYEVESKVLSVVSQTATSTTATYSPDGDFIEDIPCYTQTKFRVKKNSYQIRWGMQFTCNPAGINNTQNVTVINVERINYDEVEVTVDAYIPLLAADQTFLLHADRVLNFDTSRPITATNVVDGMLFWTDGFSEPKKINIERGKAGSTAVDFPLNSQHSNSVYDDEQYTYSYAENDHGGGPTGQELAMQHWSDFDQHTRLIVNGENPVDCMKEEDLLCEGTPPSEFYCGCTISQFSGAYVVAVVDKDGIYTGWYDLRGEVRDEDVPEYNPYALLDDGSCTCCAEINIDPSFSTNAGNGQPPNAAKISITSEANIAPPTEGLVDDPTPMSSEFPGTENYTESSPEAQAMFNHVPGENQLAKDFWDFYNPLKYFLYLSYFIF